MSDVTVYYLEMTSPDDLRAKVAPDDLYVMECEIGQYPFNRFLYQWIGGPWHWTDRLNWNDEQWRHCVECDEHRTIVAYYRGAIAGYYELLREDDAVEILYFGLNQAFFGAGFGGYLLTNAIETAWQWSGCTRVWVHTCSCDHPAALGNYLARGMRIYDEKKE